jgi:signal transduction histidine kinase
MPNTQHRNTKSEFRLVRYFSIAGCVAFLVVAVVLYLLERRESEYFRQVQQAQRNFVAQVQEGFAREQEAAARRDLLLVHEAGHVNMTRLLANAMWATHIAPFIAKAERISTEHCHALGGNIIPANVTASASAVTECFAEVGKNIAALPEFAALDAKVATTIRTSTVFKVKVFDMRGITVYSSEHAQIGEDKYNNQGWRMAAGGDPASELTHRDKFSAFEGIVENRDLISSYVPVKSADGAKVVGVFEIYSDVTPFLEQIKTAYAHIANRAAMKQTRLDQTAAENQQKVEAASLQLLAIIAILLIMLYAVLLFIVRHAQRILDAQAQAQALFIQREARWHHEKMSALSTMAATVAHEIGNPLATIAALAESVADDNPANATNANASKLILEQTQRIAAKTRQITTFAATRSEALEPVDVNQMVKAVCDFLAFDRSFQATKIEFDGAANLPARVIIPDHLTESLMNLLQAYVEYAGEHQTPPTVIRVETRAQDADVLIRMSSDAVPADAFFAHAGTNPRLETTRRRVLAMGGSLTAAGKAMEIALPATANGKSIAPDTALSGYGHRA